MAKRMALGSAVNCIVFIGIWILTGLHLMTSSWTTWGTVLFRGTAGIGLVCGVFGFWMVTRSVTSTMKSAVVCILFAMIPGCVGLVELLSRFGSNVV